MISEGGSLEGYRATLARLAPLVEAADVVVPGYGSPHDRATALRLLDEDADYLNALERGDERPKLPAGRDTKAQRQIHAENLARGVPWLRRPCGLKESGKAVKKEGKSRRPGCVGSLAAGLVLTALASPLASSAAAVEARLDRLPFDCSRIQCPPDHSDRLVVLAGRGEANRLHVARGPAGQFQVTDAGAQLVAGPGCAAVAERVDCQTSSPYVTAFMFAGDQDDTVTSAVAVNVDGGRGDDLLTGSPLADALYGGEGTDVLRGEAGDDALQDGRLFALSPPEWVSSGYYRTFLAPVTAERDAFDGGEGVDTLGYSGRRRAVAADLARGDPHAGTRGEGDSLRGLEALVGGNGNDRLLGNDTANSLLGDAGDDLLVGRAGDDQLTGGPGSNRLHGDAGNDSIGVDSAATAPPFERQRVACGSGTDSVLALYPNDFAEDDCETIFVGEFFDINALLPPLGWRRPPLASYTTEPVDCDAPSCRLRLEVRLARSPSRRLTHLKGLVLGRAGATIPYRAVTTFTVHLSGRGSRLLRRHRSLLIRISLKKISPDDPRVAEGPAGAYLTRLRAPS